MLKCLQDETERDTNLLRRVNNGDELAVSELYDYYSDYLYTTICYIIKDEADAEDILLEVFYILWDKAALYDEKLGKPISWMTRVARNKAIDKLRIKKLLTDINGIDETCIIDLNEDHKKLNPEFSTVINQEQEEVLAAIKELDEIQINLIEYAYYKGYSQSELSEHFCIPLGTVKSKIRAAIKFLRERLSHLNEVQIRKAYAS